MFYAVYSVPHRNTFNVLNAYKVNDDTRACNGVRDNGVNHFNDTRPIRQVTLAVGGKGVNLLLYIPRQQVNMMCMREARDCETKLLKR